MAHNLVGSSATFGAIEVCKYSKELVESFKKLLKDNELFDGLESKVSDIIKILNKSIIDWQPEKISYVIPLKN